MRPKSFLLQSLLLLLLLRRQGAMRPKSFLLPSLLLLLLLQERVTVSVQRIVRIHFGFFSVYVLMVWSISSDSTSRFAARYLGKAQGYRARALQAAMPLH